MSLHSYSKCWLHIIWSTLDRAHLLSTHELRKEVSGYLLDYASSKNIYMKTNFVNSEHVHALIDLPTNLSIEDALHLFKGSSSHWINQNGFIREKFMWGRGYGAFSVSESNLAKVVNYIKTQEEHHKKKSFTEEYQEFIQAYGMKFYHED
ncbi:MAG: IS200/IS605 family transposase [Ignavibacteriales bacterium]|nr:IS200/IS605 family transposase [Ignavibacteriales bacterium]